MFVSGKSAAEIVQEEGLEQISDTSARESVIDEVIAENPGPVEDVRGGKEQAIGFLVGQVMRKTQGQANPGMVNEMLRERVKGEG